MTSANSPRQMTICGETAGSLAGDRVGGSSLVQHIANIDYYGEVGEGSRQPIISQVI